MLTLTKATTAILFAGYGMPASSSALSSSAEDCWREHHQHHDHCRFKKWDVSMTHLKSKMTRHRYGIQFSTPKPKVAPSNTYHFLSNGVSVTTQAQRMPTPWRESYFTEKCQQRRKQESLSHYFIFCQPNVPVLYSPSLKIAYMKTPKAASTSFAEHFLTRYSDTVMGTMQELNLPNDTFVFTFVRDPMAQKLAAYAEIDVVYQENLFAHRKVAMHTTFQWVDRQNNDGRSRFVAFLDDIRMKRFGKAFPTNWSPSHFRSQLAAPFCSDRLNFIGHLEHLETDWQAIQALANVPEQMRTEAIRVDHAGNQSANYRADEKLALGSSEKMQLCDLFKSDFLCLGYQVPPECVPIFTHSKNSSNGTAFFSNFANKGLYRKKHAESQHVALQNEELGLQNEDQFRSEPGPWSYVTGAFNRSSGASRY